MDPLTATLLAVIVALLRGDRTTAERLMDGLTPLLETGPTIVAPNLLWEPRQLVGGEPAKIFEANPSPRRRVVLWNSGSVEIRIAESRGKLDAGSGGPLAIGGILIDEPPNPHGGEWWGEADLNTSMTVAQLL